MTKRAAVLDLGTNTFQILIGERRGDDVHWLHRDERWVNLAEDGIERIGDGAMRRMRGVLSDYRAVMDSFQPDVVKASGTAAFRRASNRSVASALVEEIIGVAPDVIAGEEEAALIYQGVRLAASDLNETVLVMDIGGGSTEFIIGYKDTILWKKSYPLGATLLRQQFHKTDPIANGDMAALHKHVFESTEDLRQATALHQPVALIGASGSFESFSSMLKHPDEPPNALVELDAKELNGLINELVVMKEAERRLRPGLVWFRVGPIVAASVLTQTVVSMCSFGRVYRSAYALKEGLMKGLLEGRNDVLFSD